MLIKAKKHFTKQHCQPKSRVGILFLTVWFSLLSQFAHSQPVTIDSLTFPVSLAGEWSTQLGDDIEWAKKNYDDTHWRRVHVPIDRSGTGIPKDQEWAWFRHRVIFDLEQDQQVMLDRLSIRMGMVVTSYELYANGQLVGGVGNVNSKYEFDYDIQKLIAIPRQLIGDDGVLQLALRVNRAEDLYCCKEGGPYRGEFLIGATDALLFQQFYDNVISLFLAVFYLFIGAWFIGLFRHVPSLLSYKWFGALALAVAIYTFMISEWKYLFDWSFFWQKKIEYCAIFVAPYLLMRFLFIHLEITPHKVVRQYTHGMVFIVSASAISISLNQLFVIQTIWQLYLMPSIFIVLFYIGMAIKARRQDVKLLTIALVILMLATINDLLVVNRVIYSYRLGSLSFGLVIFALSASLLNKFNMSHLQLSREAQSQTRALRSAVDELSHAAKFDGLTKLFNRRTVLEFIEQSEQQGENFAILMIDLDKFKSINDNYGHLHGDQVLVNVASIINSTLRPQDYAGRWGGEEFIVVLNDVNIAIAKHIAERIRSAIKDSNVEIQRYTVRTTATIGVAEHEAGQRAETTISRADKAMYDGKRAGRNCVMVAHTVE